LNTLPDRQRHLLDVVLVLFGSRRCERGEPVPRYVLAIEHVELRDEFLSLCRRHLRPRAFGVIPQVERGDADYAVSKGVLCPLPVGRGGRRSLVFWEEFDLGDEWNVEASCAAVVDVLTSSPSGSVPEESERDVLQTSFQPVG
jgi:hypothetical protein